ncbi:MAG: tetratricopeptide repeat protein, partial [Planctomycetota bacterium]
LAVAALVVIAGCTTGPRRSDDAVDPAAYTNCQDPDAAAAWQRAQAALAKGDDAAALPDLVLVTSGCPDLVRAHLAWQDVARRLGGDAERTMRAFYADLPERRSPVPAYLRARLAGTPYEQGKTLEAILAADPSFAWAHLSLARVMRRQSRLLPAFEHYSKAIVNDPGLHEALGERGQVLAELGRDVEAAADFKAYLVAQPDDLQAAREYVALVLYRVGRFDEAQTWLDRLAAKSPGDANVRLDGAALLWRCGAHRRAADEYLAILRETPTVVLAALNLGLLYYEVAPKNEAEYQRYWPRARAAFRWYLDAGASAEGHEQFEQALGVPFRLQRIAELLGPEPLRAVRLDDLQWPEG